MALDPSPGGSLDKPTLQPSTQYTVTITGKDTNKINGILAYATETSGGARITAEPGSADLKVKTDCTGSTTLTHAAATAKDSVSWSFTTPSDGTGTTHYGLVYDSAGKVFHRYELLMGAAPDPAPQPTPDPAPEPTPEPTPQPTPEPVDGPASVALPKLGMAAAAIGLASFLF